MFFNYLVRLESKTLAPLTFFIVKIETREYNNQAMTTLRDFIATRETDVKAQIKALRKELSELKAAKSVLESRAAPLGHDGPVQSSMTIKDMIRDVLKSAPQGLTSTEIQAKITEHFSRQIERTSLSPQLSRMKDDSEVTLNDNMWFLPVVTESVSNSDDESLSETQNGWATDEGFGDPDFDDDYDTESPF